TNVILVLGAAIRRAPLSAATVLADHRNLDTTRAQIAACRCPDPHGFIEGSLASLEIILSKDALQLSGFARDGRHSLDVNGLPKGARSVQLRKMDKFSMFLPREVAHFDVLAGPL